jgi:hypothetical protein
LMFNGTGADLLLTGGRRAMLRGTLKHRDAEGASSPGFIQS